MKAKNKTVTNYWMEFYTTLHCTICGNCGIIDSRGVKTPAGTEVGRLNWCICPNGQALRKHHGEALPAESDELKYRLPSRMGCRCTTHESGQVKACRN